MRCGNGGGLVGGSSSDWAIRVAVRFAANVETVSCITQSSVNAKDTGQFGLNVRNSGGVVLVYGSPGTMGRTVGDLFCVECLPDDSRVNKFANGARFLSPGTLC